MADFECDTGRLYDDGKKVLEYTKSINDKLGDFFDIIDSLDTNGVWNDKNSFYFRENARTEKVAPFEFVAGIKSIGNFMVDYAEDLEELIAKNEREFDN